MRATIHTQAQRHGGMVKRFELHPSPNPDYDMRASRQGGASPTYSLADAGIVPGGGRDGSA